VPPAEDARWGREDSNLRLITYSVSCGVADYVRYSRRSGVFLKSLKRQTIIPADEASWARAFRNSTPTI
jgi:hypothetical protein